MEGEGKLSSPYLPPQWAHEEQLSLPQLGPPTMPSLSVIYYSSN